MKASLPRVASIGLFVAISISAMVPAKRSRTHDWPGATLLHIAAEKWDLQKTKEALESGIDPNNGDEWGLTAAHYAAMYSTDMCCLFVYNKKSPRFGQLVPDEGGQEVLQLLVGLPGVNLNAQACGGMTPLHISVGSGLIARTSILLRAGADPNVADGSGMTALHHAVAPSNHCCEDYHDYNHVLSLVLARPDVDLEVRTRRGNTALQGAAILGWVGSLRLLLQAGASMTPGNDECWPRAR